jgi:hypothetical protein
MAVAVMLFLAGGAARVYGQEACTFTQGFAELRRLVGEQKVGACLENEQSNADNGNAEQRTTGGLLVWRKADNFTAFTDGGTTWVNGPNGLESRPNDVRLAWELDPIAPPAAPAPAPTQRPLPTLPPTSPLSAEQPVQAPRVVNDGGTIAAPNYGAQAGAQTSTPRVASAPPPVTSPANAGTPTPAGNPAGISAAANSTSASTLPPPPSAANTVAAAAPAAVPAPAASATPTKTPTPTPAVTAKFSERPDDVDTGNDAHFEVETSAKKGSCTLVVTYRDSPETSLGAKEIDDGRCEWKYTLPADVKTGKAKAVVTVAATEGTVKIEDTFSVKKGDTVYSGSIDLDIDPTDMPDDDVQPGQEIKIGVDTNLKRKGSCALTMTWPKLGPVAIESQMPDDKGRCNWKVKVPAEAPRNSEGSLTITVHKDSAIYRTLKRDFEIAK